jgi:hypothetical protein
VSFLLDESGSMAAVLDPTIDGSNEYLTDLQPGTLANTVRFSLSTFDSTRFIRRTIATPIGDVPKLHRDSYQPGSGTPLYDAIGETINDLETRLAGAEKPEVIVTILTDGLENASQIYNVAGIRKLIREKEAAGWTFAYLRANQDAWEVAESMGISRRSSASYTSDPHGVRNAMRSTSRSTRSSWAREERNRVGFFADETDADGFLRGDQAAVGPETIV